MVPRLFAVCVMLLGCLQPRSQIRYRLENQLEACIEIRAAQSSWIHGLAVLEVRYRETRSVARCGCKSAVTTFSAYAERPSGKRFLASGSITLAHNDLVTLPLAVDRDLLGDSPVLVSLGCEAPD